MGRGKSTLVGLSVLFFAPTAYALAVIAQSHMVTITGGYDKTVQTQRWMQTGTTSQPYTYQEDVTTDESERVQTGTLTRNVFMGLEHQEAGTITKTVQVGTKRVQTGTTSACDGQWMYYVDRRRYECTGAMVQTPVFNTVPVYRTETIPVFKTVPVYETQTIPVYTVESIPVTRLETFTGYKTIPVYGYVSVPSEEWIPDVIH